MHEDLLTDQLGGEYYVRKCVAEGLWMGVLANELGIIKGVYIFHLVVGVMGECRDGWWLECWE